MNSRFMTANSPSISAYTVDIETGRWQLRVSPPTGGSPVALAVDPADKFLHVTNALNDTISRYKIISDGSTGEGNGPGQITTLGENQ